MSKNEYIEQIKFDPESEEFYIFRKTELVNGKFDFERKPLSEWGLSKKIECCATVIRKLEQASFEHPNKLIFYKLPLTYEILDIESGAHIYLKIEKSPVEEEIKSDNPKWGIIRIFLRDINNSTCMTVPLPNDMYNKEDFPFLKITKGLAEEITRKQVYEAWKSGSCIGNYDFELKNRLTA